MRDVNRIRLAGLNDDGFARRRHHALAIGLLFDITRRRCHDDALLRVFFSVPWLAARWRIT